MPRFASLSTALLLGARAYAIYDEWFFASEKTEWKCPNFGFDCIAPQVCAHEGLTDKYYCCSGGSGDAVCWNGATECGAEDGQPSSNQIGCSSGQSAFCCLANREECTQRYNQINICWATPPNPIANVSLAKLNETFSSLSSAAPSASSWTLDVQALTATSTPASSSATATSTPASSSTSATPSQTSIQTSVSNPDGSSVSGGAIGGAVVGAIAGVALIVGGAFFLFRRKRKETQQTELDGTNNPYLRNGYTSVVQVPPQEKYAQEAASEAQPPPKPPVEMPANEHPMEMEGSKPPNNSQLH